MQFRIEKEVLDKFPELSIGVVVARNINNFGEDKEIFHLLKEVEKFIKNEFTPANIVKHKLISPWKSAFLAFGAKPEVNHTCLERLLRIVLEKGELRKESKLVDLYNFLSLKYLVPIAADDLNEIIGDISLGISNGNELFVSAVGMKGRESPKKGEIVYKDDIQVLSRRWNSEECYKTRITENTKDAILYVEGLKPVTKGEVNKISEELAGLIETFLDGNCKFVVLNAENNEIGF